MRNNLEHQHQAALIRWCELHKTHYPELEMIYSIPNEGHTSVVYGRRMKEEGRKPGVPDLCLPISNFITIAAGQAIPSDAACGLYIEMKATGKKLSEKQIWWQSRLIHQGYRHVVCDDWVKAVRVIVEYLGLPKHIIP